MALAEAAAREHIAVTFLGTSCACLIAHRLEPTGLGIRIGEVDEVVDPDAAQQVEVHRRCAPWTSLPSRQDAFSVARVGPNPRPTDYESGHRRDGGDGS